VSAPPKTNVRRDLIDDIAGFALDPYRFVMYAFPWGVKGTALADKKGPREWQAKILRDIGEKLRDARIKGVWEAIQEAVASGHGIGKSALISFIILWALSTHEDTRGIVTANTDTQLRTKTWPELSKWFGLLINRDWFQLTATAIYSRQPGHDKTWRFDAIPWSAENTEAFAGMHNEGKRIVVLFDEASAIDDKIWEVTEGALTDEGTEIIWCVFGNPTRNTGRFHAAVAGGLRHRWNHFQIDSRKVDGTNKAEIAKWIEDYGEDSDFVRVRVKGEFPRAGSNQLIGTDLIDVSKRRECVIEAYRQAPRILGVDVARHGDDQSVIVKRQGIRCEKPQRFRLDDLMKLASHVAETILEWRPDAVCIDVTGIGWGVYDRLKNLNYGHLIHGIQTGEKAFNEARYVNLRIELWDRMRIWVKDGGVLPDDPELHTDLTAPEYWLNSKDRLVLESKDDMKARGLASPDSGDALALTFATNVAPRKQVDEPEWTQRLSGMMATRRGGRPKSPMAR
jgi:hypothetical protein